MTEVTGMLALNKQQQRVIDHKTGPLLVVAGAGTGKTRVVVEKINKLLDEGTTPESILALTFTEKAAGEMLERILESRTGLLLNLPIFTFNGYGDSILKELGVHIGLPRNYKLLGEKAKIVFVRERMDEFELGHLLPLTASPDGIIEEVLRHISKLKQQLITPEQYTKAVAELPEGSEEERDFKQEQQVLAGIYTIYESLKNKAGYIDYDDQIYKVIQLLEARPSVRKKLQTRYSVIFVDEFQDTNLMQSKLIDLLVNEKQNLIVVGDDDQSIYGFRGATLANILEFKKRYPNAKEAPLTQNYRSSQEILDASYKLIQHNDPNRLEVSLGINKRLTSNKTGNPPLLKRFNGASDELSWLAQDIKARLTAQDPESPVSIAVLTRSNPSAQAVHEALEIVDIPHRVIGVNSDLYQQPVVRASLELLRTITEPNNNLSLHHTLIGPFFEVPNHIVAPLAGKARAEHSSLESLAETSDATEIQSALKTLQSLRGKADITVGRLLFMALSESGYKDRLLKKAEVDELAENAVQHLGQFFAGLKEFEKIALQPTAAQYLVSLPSLMAAGETIDDTIDISENEVIVTTVHKAKGLEWDTVYVPKVTNRSFPMANRSSGFDIPDSLIPETDTSTASEHIAEERRVMYVAVTRARQNLIVSFNSKQYETDKIDASLFINELFGERSAENCKTEDATPTGNKIIAPIESSQPTIIPQNIYDGHTVRLSVSQAQALLNCPLNFKYKFILKAPEKPVASTDYGSQLHTYFEEINLGHKNNDLRPLSEMQLELKQNFNRAGYGSKKQLEAAEKRALQTLTYFYYKAVNGPKASFVEYPFEVKLGADILLHGRIDAVFEDGKTVEIIDYKTGDRVKDSKKAKANASKSMQLTMYALAWQNLTGILPKKVALYYPDTQQAGAVSKRQQSIDTLQHNLIQAVELLKQNQFPRGKQHDYCIHP